MAKHLRLLDIIDVKKYLEIVSAKSLSVKRGRYDIV